MKVVIAVDSFKGSLSSLELGQLIENGIKKIYENAEVKKVPVADGGEGTVDALVEGTKGQFVDVKVHDPFMRLIDAKYGIMGNNVAVIEMAEASGLPLLKPEERDLRKATTYGTGELIKDAIEKGCREFIIGIGGSATNDAGLGMMQALGYKFLDKDGELLGYGGEIMGKVAEIDSSGTMDGLNKCRFSVACDVDNPFYGPKGAAHVYSRQKGADDETVEYLDLSLQKLALTLKEKTGKDISDIPGAGAAGGLGGGFVAFLDGELKPGIDIILQEVGLAESIEGADFVITGEGRIDFQSVMGKAPMGVSKMSRDKGIPVIAIAGCVADDAGAMHDHGLDAFFSTINYPVSLEEAMNKERAGTFVEKNVEEIFRLIKVCEIKYKSR
ncbi:glycerate kinase [Ilyobacter polytropus]|uniref:Glycerate kinase n=1 Tax=Ilyobacter polytropus (strain ATCC 51220 / DSM 2926 / LMG 16218 / CuHBu1) TaxID=572544 RepID=E3HBB3_ILYPC|nr:glycerate kinase [Ilyobacter polytropus]ADO82264.1 glycerate kinase [Ilyobacter polytropus DSM 2926]